MTVEDVLEAHGWSGRVGLCSCGYTLDYTTPSRYGALTRHIADELREYFSLWEQ